jgi:hypothetical protein
MTVDTSNLFIGVGAVTTSDMLRISITRLLYASDITMARDMFVAHCESLGTVLFTEVTGVLL